MPCKAPATAGYSLYCSKNIATNISSTAGIENMPATAAKDPMGPKNLAPNITDKLTILGPGMT